MVKTSHSKWPPRALPAAALDDPARGEAFANFYGQRHAGRDARSVNPITGL